jgi:hypothetical protein
MRIVGWAGRDRSIFPGLDETKDGGHYNDKDREGIPQCSEARDRFFHRNGQYPNCPGGKGMHYDISYWLTDKFGGGAVSQCQQFKAELSLKCRGETRDSGWRQLEVS